MPGLTASTTPPSCRDAILYSRHLRQSAHSPWTASSKACVLCNSNIFFSVFLALLVFFQYRPTSQPKTIMPISDLFTSFSLSRFFRRRSPASEARRRQNASKNPHHHEEDADVKPIYIYPGLIRMSAQRAVAIDSKCPASLYDPPSSSSTSRAQSSSSQSMHGNVSHDPVSDSPDHDQDDHDTCAICLQTFVPTRDIIRRLPCSHFFHSKCKYSYTWFSFFLFPLEIFFLSIF